MDKRYQIFISSTFADLKNEREKVMRAILELKCFPAGMELFKAGSKPKFTQISSVIDECDFYILIIGARYGSMDKDGVSWTEKEYNYADKQGIPILAFVHGDSGAIPLKNADLDNELRKKLKAFRERVEESSIVSYWNDANELKANVLSSLHDALEQEKKENKRTGWVRADKVVSYDAQREIERLQEEIADYKNQIKNLKADLKKKERDCDSIDKSKHEALQKVKNLQKKIDQLQKECGELRTKQQKSNKERLAIEQFYKEKVKFAEIELEKILDKLNVNITDTITLPGTSVSFNMVHVDGGTFMMGAKGDGDTFDDKNSTHQVTVSDYWIGETQVTQALWKAVMGENPSYYNDDPNLPVEQVSWNDCQDFIKELNRLTGRTFHLPTEAQWEFAACGGTKSKGYKYAGSNDIEKVAWYFDNSGRKTHAVAQKDANELGLYDMSGNVYEWCQDMFADNSDESEANLTNSAIEPYRVGRGGGWGSSAGDCCVSYRGGSSSSFTRNYLGLRLAL